MNASKRTTWSGILQLISALSLAALFVIDGDPATVPDWKQVFAALSAVGWGFGGFLGGLFARDNDVTSETAGAK